MTETLVAMNTFNNNTTGLWIFNDQGC